jgi:peptidoglycan/LPS O-acetylase OafA/YrhL
MSKPVDTSSEEQLILSLDGLHGCGAFFIVVSHLVDAAAHGIRPHDPSIAGLQQSGN